MARMLPIPRAGRARAAGSAAANLGGLVATSGSMGAAVAAGLDGEIVAAAATGRVGSAVGAAAGAGVAAGQAAAGARQVATCVVKLLSRTVRVVPFGAWSLVERPGETRIR